VFGDASREDWTSRRLTQERLADRAQISARAISDLSCTCPLATALVVCVGRGMDCMSGLAAQITTDAEINTCLTLWVLLAKALGHLGRIALVRSLRRKH